MINEQDLTRAFLDAKAAHGLRRRSWRISFRSTKPGREGDSCFERNEGGTSTRRIVQH